MGSKVLVLCFLIVSLLQGTIASVPGRRDGILGQVLKEAEAVVEQAVQQVDTAIQLVEAQVQNVASQIQSVGSNFVDEAQEQLQQSFSQIHKAFQNARSEAKKDGINVDDCVSDASQAVKLFPGESGNFDSCVSQRVSGAQQLVNVAQKGIQDAREFAEKAQHALYQCLEAPVTAVLCLSRQATQSGTGVVNIVSELEQAGQQVVQEVLGAADSIGSCVQDKVKEVSSQAQKITQEVSSCVASKQIKI